MGQKIAQGLLSHLSELMVTRLGLHFPPERWVDLERGLLTAATDFGFGDVDEFCRWLLATPLTRPQVGKLASHLTVGETYFFRDPASFESLESNILPALLRARRDGERRLRLWSAACASGEEAYSLAIAVSRAVPDLDEWNITILATDVNPLFLQKAMAGIYTGWSFRGTPDWVKDYYFVKQGNGRYKVTPQIKRLVTFAPLNLVEDAYPSLLNNTNAMDIIFCRNVLMYFAPGQIERVTGRLRNALVDGGWLITSPAEASHRLFRSFETVEFPGAIFYRREDSSPVPRQSFLPVQLIRQEDDRMRPTAPADTPDEQLEVHRPWTPPADSDSLDVANAIFERGGNQAAEEILERRLNSQPGDGPSLILLARAQANQGKLQDAYASCQKAILADRLNPTCYYLLAIIAGELGLESEARQAFRRALYLNPDFIVAHYAMGVFARGQGKQAEAEKHFVAALQLLERRPVEDLLPEGDGLTAGRLGAIIRAVGEGRS
jgi:chemotaxis protein methyltransferase CheR